MRRRFHMTMSELAAVARAANARLTIIALAYGAAASARQLHDMPNTHRLLRVAWHNGFAAAGGDNSMTAEHQRGGPCEQAAWREGYRAGIAWLRRAG